jgi:PAS domain S-box-containing protein
MSARRNRRIRVMQQNAKTYSWIVVGGLLLLSLYTFFIILYYLGTIELTIATGLLSSIVVIGGTYLIFTMRDYVGNYTAIVEKQTVKTETKSEGKYHALIQNSLDLITIIDPKGVINYQSPSSDRLLGYAPEELVGQSLYEIIHGEDHALLQNALNQKSQTFFFSFRMQHRDGTWLYFDSVGTNLTGNPMVNGIVLNSRDVSDRKREEEKRRQKEMAAMKLGLEKEKAENERRIIEESKKKIEDAYGIIEHKNQEITDSITYAFRIQTAIIPSVDIIKQYLPHAFVLWRPKDIVSGDFYWFAHTGDFTLISAADCTGHGVPGAFMTMIGNTILNQVVLTERETRPDLVLNKLHNGIRKMLKQDQVGSQSRDGMDLSMLALDHKNNKIYYAGANNPLIVVRDGVHVEYKADKKAIGGLQTEDERQFTLNEIDAKTGDMIYLFSDGYEDQFGGPNGRKFMSKRMKRQFEEISILPIDEQYRKMEEAIVEWMGDRYDQIDDILVLGIRVA